MAQADLAIIARALIDLGDQIPLIFNHPAVQVLAQAQTFQEEVRGQFRRNDEQFARLQATLDAMRQEFHLRFDQMAADQALLPLRLYNSSCGNKAKLCYPNGVQAREITRDDLYTLTALECQQLAVPFGLPALLPNASY